MTRSETLDKAKACVCGQRENEYGSPEDNFTAIAGFWSVYIMNNEVVEATEEVIENAGLSKGVKDVYKRQVQGRKGSYCTRREQRMHRCMLENRTPV